MKDINIHFIRHGQSEENAARSKGIGQEPDGPLSKLGEMQSKYLGDRIDRSIKFDRVFYSPYKRAADTCKIAIKNKFSIAQVSDALVEYNPGDFKGRQISDVYSDLNVVPKIIYQNLYYKFPNGESLSQTGRRAGDFIEKNIIHNKEVLALAEEREVNIGIFSHGILIKTALHYIMGFNANIILNIKIDNTAISKAIFNDRGWHIASINDTGHLVSV